MIDNKLMALLKSRKMWASLIGLAVSLGLYNAGDIEAEKLVDAILIIVSAFVGGTAIESGLQHRQ